MSIELQLVWKDGDPRMGDETVSDLSELEELVEQLTEPTNDDEPSYTEEEIRFVVVGGDSDVEFLIRNIFRQNSILDLEEASALLEFLDTNGEDTNLMVNAFIAVCELGEKPKAVLAELSTSRAFDLIAHGPEHREDTAWASFAEDRVEGMDIPETIYRYIDFAAMGADMRHDGYSSVEFNGNWYIYSDTDR